MLIVEVLSQRVREVSVIERAARLSGANRGSLMAATDVAEALPTGRSSRREGERGAASP